MDYTTKEPSNAGAFELREPAAVAYDPRPRTAREPWTVITGGYAEADISTNNYNDYSDDFDDEEPLPDGWEEELLNDPEFNAELNRRCDETDAQIAAGTFVGYTTDEVFERLHREFPQLFGGGANG